MSKNGGGKGDRKREFEKVFLAVIEGRFLAVIASRRRSNPVVDVRDKPRNPGFTASDKFRNSRCDDFF